MEEIEKKWRESSDRAENLQENLQTTSESLKRVQADSGSLRNESPDFLRLKHEHESAISNLKTVQAAVQRLTKENEVLEHSRTAQWLLAGALILVVAWLIGLIIGRREKRRPRSLSR